MNNLGINTVICNNLDDGNLSSSTTTNSSINNCFTTNLMPVTAFLNNSAVDTVFDHQHHIQSINTDHHPQQRTVI